MVHLVPGVESWFENIGSELSLTPFIVEWFQYIGGHPWMMSDFGVGRYYCPSWTPYSKIGSL